jgi:hypothetical protein
MSNDLTSPLQALLNKAAKNLPVKTGKVEEMQRKFDRRKGQVVVLADISGSMSAEAFGGKTKLEYLRIAVDIILKKYQARLFVFSDSAREVKSIPDEAYGGTALHIALDAVSKIDPGVTLVISDGHPDDKWAALAAAKAFRGVIDVLYIGSDSDKKAIDFMRELAGVTDGDLKTYDIVKLGKSNNLITYIAEFLALKNN